MASYREESFPTAPTHGPMIDPLGYEPVTESSYR